MSALFRAHSRRAVDALAPAGDAAHMHRVGVYLTDEVFLFRVVGVVAAQGKGMVELEDCYGLDVVRVPATGLRARRLRVVTPRPVES